MAAVSYFEMLVISSVKIPFYNILSYKFYHLCHILKYMQTTGQSSLVEAPINGNGGLIIYVFVENFHINKNLGFQKFVT